ncbi:MAG: MMPL family transporter [Deltaproteobacteria bacterium]|jgi:hopanoid biosynthesis associated RND transporter like protein HpnN
MANNFLEQTNRILGGWVYLTHRYALALVLFASVASAALLHYTANNLGINTDTAEMLSETLSFRRNYKAFKNAFPQYDDALLIVVDADTPELAQDASKAMAAQLEKRRDLFSMVYLPGGDRFFQKHGLMYLTPAELQDLADNLAQIQPFLGRLTRDQTLRGLFSMLTAGMGAVMEGQEIDLTPVFDRIHLAIEASMGQQQYSLSWQELMLGTNLTPDDRRCFILTKPQLDYRRPFPAEGAIKEVRRLANNLHLTDENGVRVRLTGDAALEYEELLSVTHGAGLAGILALITVGIVLFLGLRSPKMVLATLITMIMGLIWTASFAAAAVGQLNLISVAFAVLYIGLSVDYAIHFCLRYKELLQQAVPPTTALEQTARDIGTSLILCSITTAIGFYAFIPTVFAGVAELGLISGTGMFISLIANLTILPALLSLMALNPDTLPAKPKRKGLAAELLALPSQNSRFIRIAALGLGLGAALLLPYATFDSNPMNLRDPSSESVVTFKELLAQSKNSPWTLTVLASNRDDAARFARSLSKLKPVDMSLTLEKFVPTDQEEKLAIIDEIDLIVGPELSGNSNQSPPTAREQITSLRDLSATLDEYLKTNPTTPLAKAASRLQDSLSRFLAGLSNQKPAIEEEILGNLQTSLLGSLPARLDALATSLEAGKITRDDLPEDLVEHWVSKDNHYRVTVFPRENLNDNAAMRRFVTAVRTVAPDAIGFPVIYLEAGAAVVEAFKQAFVMALIAVTVLLLILLRPKSDTLLVLLPLLLAGVLTGAASVVFGIPFNFANVIALPLLLGIGVDSGIHMVHRMRAAPPPSGLLLETSTARAVLYSSLTTICSFGNLAVSPHRGMASMGVLLTIGIFFTLICTLVVLPALMVSGNKSAAASKAK